MDTSVAVVKSAVVSFVDALVGQVWAKRFAGGNVCESIIFRLLI